MDYLKLSWVDREKYLIPLIIQSLQNLGGEANRDAIKEEMCNIDSKIVDIMEITRTGKTGPYHPFDWNFNIAIKTLLFAEFVTFERAKPVKLTSKGINCNPYQIDLDNEVYKLSEPKWKEKSQANKAAKDATNHIDEPSNDNEDKNDDPLDSINNEFRDKLLSAISEMNPRKFEILCRRILKEMGMTIDNNKGISYTGDGGIDGYGYRTDGDFRTFRVAIQAKRWQGKVSAPEIDRFRGAMDKFRADYGLFITNSDFTDSAITASREGSKMITLINGEKLVELIKRYNVYVTPVTTYVISDWFDEN